MHYNPFYDEELIRNLLSLHDRNPNKFMDLVMEAIKENPEVVINEESDPEKKMLALSRIRQHYAEREEYENCAIIKELEDKINGKT